MVLPRFHEDLGPDGHLYMLAVVAGRYLHRNSGGSEPAHFVLRWSPSPDLSPFSLGSVAADGRYLSYHRLVDGPHTPEFALLRAAGGEGVPAHCWRLYPPSALPEGEFAAAGHRAGYFAARRRLAAVLYQIRGWAALGPDRRTTCCSGRTIRPGPGDRRRLLQMLRSCSAPRSTNLGKAPRFLTSNLGGLRRPLGMTAVNHSLRGQDGAGRCQDVESLN